MIHFHVDTHTTEMINCELFEGKQRPNKLLKIIYARVIGSRQFVSTLTITRICSCNECERQKPTKVRKRKTWNLKKYIKKCIRLVRREKE